MPFLTDKMQSTQREDRLKRALADENRISSLSAVSGHSDGLANSRFNFDLVRIELELRDHIIGQDHAIDNLMQYLRTICADIGDPRKPLVSMLFTGPTGVGKTETVRLLARAMYGDADAVCRIDMNTLAQEHYAAALTGAPPGYVGSKEGTTILDQTKIEGSRNLPGIVLFDELEKASDEVVMALLNVFDNGILTVASGERTISFRNAIIFMTSNLGTQQLDTLWSRISARLKTRQGTNENAAMDAMMSSLLARFPPEFVNRIDHIEIFNKIDVTRLPEIVAVEIEHLNARLRKHNYHLELEPEVVSYIARQGYDERFGARDIRRKIRKHLEFPLSNFLLAISSDSESSPEAQRIVARLCGQTINFEKIKKGAVSE
uniref:AAA family ATPase n=1 Tax=Pararhizobium sp. IMCC3301 TaxID=3067904 RepID=UPI0027427D58|nr:AAA family ATPase [Pararhizobium sp. IMCC3301]